MVKNSAFRNPSKPSSLLSVITDCKDGSRLESSTAETDRRVKFSPMIQSSDPVTQKTGEDFFYPFLCLNSVSFKEDRDIGFTLRERKILRRIFFKNSNNIR